MCTLNAASAWCFHVRGSMWYSMGRPQHTLCCIHGCGLWCLAAQCGPACSTAQEQHTGTLPQPGDPHTVHVCMGDSQPKQSSRVAQQALGRGRGQAWAKLQKLCKGVWGCQLFSAWMSTFWSTWKCTEPLQVPCMASSLPPSPPPPPLPPRPGRTAGGRPRAAVMQRVGREYLGNHPYYKS